MKTTKRKIFALFAAISVLITGLMLSACGTDSKGSGAADTESTSKAAPAVEDDTFDDAPDLPHEDTNPNTDPSDEEPEAQTSAVITNAVVVSAHHNQGTDRVIFECGAVLEGYPGGYAPFKFSVPAAAIEFKPDEIGFDGLAGVLIDIEFSGIFEESYPMGAVGVTKVICVGVAAEQEAFDECKALFDELIAEPESCVQQGWIVENAYIISARELEGGEKVSIIADAQLGTCGMKDTVEIIIDKNKIKDEDGNPINPLEVEPGRCIEFAYLEESYTEQGSPIFCTIEDANYLIIRKDSEKVSAATLEALEGYNK